MKIILDTNVFVSGLFFSGPPYQILQAWRDDKVLACAIAGGEKLVVSGDKHLLRVSGYQGLTVMKPREFVDRYLKP